MTDREDSAASAGAGVAPDAPVQTGVVAAGPAGRAAARGALWMVMTSTVARVVGVLGTVIITRFLAPEVVGEVSAATILTMTAGWLTTWGFGSYTVVYGRGEDAAEVTWHATVAYVGLGVVSLLAVIALAPTLTGLLDAPTAARFVPGMALSVYIRRFGAMPEKVLTREMQFRAIGLAAAVGELAYVITSVTLAARGWGGDSIVIGNVVQATVTVAILIRAAGVRSWATPTPLRMARVRSMLKFGVPLAIQSIAHNAARYWDNLTVAFLFGTRALGRYNLAYNLADIPATQIGEQLALVLLPAMANLPAERRPAALERATALLSVIIFPLAIGLGLVATPLIALVLSDKWQGVAPLLAVLAVLSVFRPLSGMMSVYMEAQGRTGRLMSLEVGKVVVLIGGLFALSGFGLQWASCAVGISYGLNAIAAMWLVSGEGVSPRRLTAGFVQPLLACVVMAAAVITVRSALTGRTPPAIQLAVEIVTGAVVYIGAAFVICGPTVRDLLSVARNVRARRR